MSLFVPKPDESVIVRGAEAEVVGGTPVRVRLLADNSATGGALSTVRVTLAEGTDGARPHVHHNSAEMFYLLDGSAQILSGDDIVTAERGDLVIVTRASSKGRSDMTITSSRASFGKGAADLMGVRPTSWA